jgi:hypothetical protein
LDGTSADSRKRIGFFVHTLAHNERVLRDTPRRIENPVVLVKYLNSESRRVGSCFRGDSSRSA